MITIKFVKSGVISAVQDGDSPDCGFGHNVTVNGTYKKFKRQPVFTEPSQ